MAKQSKTAIYLNDEKWKTVNQNLKQVISIAKTKYLKLFGDINYDENEFQKWLAEDFFDGNLRYWRNMRDGRKPYSRPFIEKVEKLHDLPPGFLTNDDESEVFSRKHFFDTMLFVRQYLHDNKITLDPENELKLFKLVYSDSVDNGSHSIDALKRFLEVLL